MRLLPAAELGATYEGAWKDWTAAGEAEAWDATAGDGLGNDAPGNESSP